MQLVDWGTRRFYAGQRNKTALADLLRLFHPSVLVLRELPADSKRNTPRHAQLVRKIATEARVAKTPIRWVSEQSLAQFFQKSGVVTKQKMAANMAELFPDIAWKLPPPRKPWQPEHWRISRVVAMDKDNTYAKPVLKPPKFRTTSRADLHFKIWHRFRAPGTECAPGEEVAAVSLITPHSEVHVPLSLTLRLVFDLLARHRHVPLSAAHIAATSRVDPFYRKHGCNARTSELIRRVGKSSVRVYIERIRLGLLLSFRQANLRVDARDVLVSQETVTNEVGYRLRGTFEWVHTNHPGPEFAWVS
jgi:hypothetical protein